MNIPTLPRWRYIKAIWMTFSIIITCLLLSSCSKDDPNNDNPDSQHTVLLFMPWTGDATNNHGLYSSFIQNLNSIEQAVIDNKGYAGHLIVFLSTSASESQLYEIVYDNGNIRRNTIKTYTDTSYTTASGLAQVLNDVKATTRSSSFSMIIGGHGSGWTYAADWEQSSHAAKAAPHSTAHDDEASPYPTTRFFGSHLPNEYAIDIETLAKGISQTGITLQYLLFDNCYMANIETAYELRHVTNWLIASTSEIISIGMPYSSMWSNLSASDPSYKNIVDSYYDFYSSYSTPCGSLSAIDCRQMDDLASMMRDINSRYTITDAITDSIQVLDGYKSAMFYDLGDYVDHLCTDSTLLDEFHTLLKRAVPYASTTNTLYSYIYDRPTYITVNTFCGITISDPSQNQIAANGKTRTAWWKATHAE